MAGNEYVYNNRAGTNYVSTRTYRYILPIVYNTHVAQLMEISGCMGVHARRSASAAKERLAVHMA